MHSSRKAKLTCAVVALVCLVLIVPVQMRIDGLRNTLMQQNIMPSQLPQSAAASAALGGFRGLAVDILWVQADNMLNERQYYQLMTYYELISLLQPNFPSVWEFNAWNLAYNISAEWARPEEKWLWVKKGIDFTREGIRYNPDSADLYFYVGWLYFHKVAKDPYFTEVVMREEGIEPYLTAYNNFTKALEIAQLTSGVDVRLDEMRWQAMYRHGLAVRATGNVPEAVRCYDQAIAGTQRLLVQYPEDPALLNLLSEIKAERAKFPS